MEKKKTYTTHGVEDTDTERPCHRIVVVRNQSNHHHHHHHTNNNNNNNKSSTRSTSLFSVFCLSV